MYVSCWHIYSPRLAVNPLPTIGNSLRKQKSLYKVLMPSIKPPILWAYGSSKRIYASLVVNGRSLSATSTCPGRRAPRSLQRARYAPGLEHSLACVLLAHLCRERVYLDRLLLDLTITPFLFLSPIAVQEASSWCNVWRRRGRRGVGSQSLKMDSQPSSRGSHTPSVSMLWPWPSCTEQHESWSTRWGLSYDKLGAPTMTVTSPVTMHHVLNGFCWKQSAFSFKST